MSKKEFIEYSLNNSDFYTKSEFIKKYSINNYTFNNLRNNGKLYKKINGTVCNKIHIAKGNKCTVFFADCAEPTLIFKLEKYKFKNGEKGDYMIIFKDINGCLVEILMNINEFQTMFGFIIAFQRYDNIEMEKRLLINRFGKGVEFI